MMMGAWCLFFIAVLLSTQATEYHRKKGTKEQQPDSQWQERDHAEPYSLAAALEIVLGPSPTNPLFSQPSTGFWNSTSSSNGLPTSRVRRRCLYFLACEHETPALEIDGAIFFEGVLYLNNIDNQSMSALADLRRFYQSLRGRKVDASSDYLPPTRSLLHGAAHHFEGLPMKVITPDSPVANMGCSQTWDSSVYFQHPYFTDNSFHALNDNVFAVLTSMLLQHITGAAAGRGSHRTLFVFRDKDQARPRSLSSMWRLLTVLFDEVRNARDVMSGGPHCVRHMAYAGAIQPMYMHTMVTLRRTLYLVLQVALRRLPTYPSKPAPELRFPGEPDGPPAAHSATTAGSTATIRRAGNAGGAGRKRNAGNSESSRIRPPRVVIITRNTSHSETPMKTARRRLSRQSEHALRDKFEARGARVAICCDWGLYNTLSKQLAFFGYADVIVAIHGAGLANTIFAPMGVVLAELQDYGWGEVYFAMMAHAGGGDYIWVDAGELPKELVEAKGVGIVLTEGVMDGVVKASLRQYYEIRRRGVGAAGISSATAAAGASSATAAAGTSSATATTAVAASNPQGSIFDGVDYSFLTSYNKELSQPPGTGYRNDSTLLELVSQPKGKRMWVMRNPTAFAIDAAHASARLHTVAARAHQSTTAAGLSTSAGAGLSTASASGQDRSTPASLSPDPSGQWWPDPPLRAILGSIVANRTNEELCHRLPYYKLRIDIMEGDTQATWCEKESSFTLAGERQNIINSFYSEFVL